MPSSRLVAFITLTAVALAASVTAAFLSGVGGGLAGSVEGFSSVSSNLLDSLAGWLAFGFAFGAGMVSAVNPCGFAMLPAFLGLFLSESVTVSTGVSGIKLRRFRQALVVSVAVTIGFILLFSLVGSAVAIGARGLADILPWLGLVTGVLLLVAGAWLVTGGTLYSNLGDRLSRSFAGGSTDSSAPLRFFAFGLAYALASLSCTLPVFLAVIGTTLTLGSFPAMLAQLALYGLGMGTVIALLAVGMALFEQVLISRVRKGVRYVKPLSAWLLLIAGVYIVFYWLSVGGLESALTQAV